GSDTKTTIFDGAHRNAQPVAFFSHPVFRRDKTLVEKNVSGRERAKAELVLVWLQVEPRRIALDNKCANRFARILAIEGGKSQDPIRDFKKADPCLAAAQHITVTTTGGGGLHCRHIGARMRFGEAGCCERF